MTGSLELSDSIVLLFSCSDRGERECSQRALERDSCHHNPDFHYYVLQPMREASSVRVLLFRTLTLWWPLCARVVEA